MGKIKSPIAPIVLKTNIEKKFKKKVWMKCVNVESCEIVDSRCIKSTFAFIKDCI